MHLCMLKIKQSNYSFLFNQKRISKRTEEKGTSAKYMLDLF